MTGRSRANLLFFSGLCASVGFVFLPWLGAKLAVTALAAGVVLGTGQRLRPVLILMTVGAIMVFNLFPPLGREWGVVWGFPVTEGAVRLGFERAVTFQGLLLISRATVSRGLELPGTFGKLVAETFRCFGIICRSRIRISLRHSIASLDRILEEIESEQAGRKRPPSA